MHFLYSILWLLQLMAWLFVIWRCSQLMREVWLLRLGLIPQSSLTPCHLSISCQTLVSEWWIQPSAPDCLTPSTIHLLDQTLCNSISKCVCLSGVSVYVHCDIRQQYSVSVCLVGEESMTWVNELVLEMSALNFPWVIFDTVGWWKPVPFVLKDSIAQQLKGTC